MRAMMAYMATRNRNEMRGNSNEMRRGNRSEMYGEGGNSNEMRRGNRSEMYGEGGNTNEMRGGDSNEMRGNYNEMRGGNRSEMYGAAEMNEMRRGRQPNQYTRRSGMDEDWPEDNGGMEMRRRRDRKGRFMEAYDEDEMEDARAYQARNEYRPMGENYGRAENRRRMNERYIPPMMPTNGLYDGGGIGFGTRDREYETRSHYGGAEGGKRQSAKVGGTMWMEPEGGQMVEMNRETAEKWVRSMRNEDSARPSGGRWTMEELKPMAQKFGIEPDSEEFYEFYAMTNAMYSDYCSVAKKFNITSPEFYGLMAKAWMHDKDAMPDKTAKYYEYIVKKSE